MTYHVFIGREYAYWRPFDSLDSAQVGIRSAGFKVAYIEVHETPFPDFGLIINTITYKPGETLTSDDNSPHTKEL